jgi:hypothetical protein
LANYRNSNPYRSTTPYSGQTPVTSNTSTIYNEPGITYNELLYIYNFSMQSLSMQARILRVPKTLDIKAKIALQQGGIPPNSDSDRWYNFVNTQLLMRGRIKDRLLTTTTISLRARIAPTRTSVLQIKAYIRLAQHLQIQASIKAVVGYVHLPCTFYARSVASNHLRMVFYTNTGFAQTRTLSAQACIRQMAQRRFTGHFIVPMPPQTETVRTLTNSSNIDYNQTISMKAFIL